MPKTVNKIIDKLMFKTLTSDQKNVVISTTIMTLVNNGCDIKLALDLVLGEGTYEKIAGEIYDALNTKKEGTK
jgi:hypothetical protein